MAGKDNSTKRGTRSERSCKVDGRLLEQNTFLKRVVLMRNQEAACNFSIIEPKRYLAGGRKLLV